MPQPLAGTNLFKPIKVGTVTLANRLVHAPTTRRRATDDFVPTDSMLTYYKQRAENNGGLIIAEAAFASPEFGLAHNAPMIKSRAQIESWKKIVEAVHARGTSISLQLWNIGGAGEPDTLKNHGLPLRGVSAVYFDESARQAAENADNPIRELTIPEIKDIIREFGEGAKRAINEAGFDFVEVHTANMYLADEFLNCSTNHRTDEYGGSVENRARFMLEAVDSVIDAIGPERTAMRISPYSFYQGGEGLKAKINPVVTYGYILSELERRAKEGKRIAYVSFIEPRVSEEDPSQAQCSVDTSWVNEIWKGIILRCGALLSDPDYTDLKAYVDGDDRTLIGASRFYTSNPDLAERLRKGHELTHYDRYTFYNQDNPGYITWGKYGEKTLLTMGFPRHWHELSS